MVQLECSHATVQPSLKSVSHRPKLFGDAALSFAYHFFNFSTKSSYENPQKSDLRFVSVNKRTAKWQAAGMDGMEAHIIKNVIRFVHNGNLILSLDLIMARRLNALPILPHKLTVKDVNTIEDCDEISFQFGECVTDLTIYPNINDNLSIQLINNFQRLRNLTCSLHLLTHQDCDQLYLSTLNIKKINDLHGLFNTKNHNIKTIHIQNPITLSTLSRPQAIDLVNPLILEVYVPKNLILNNYDLASYLYTSFPSIKLLKVNVMEYQTNYLLTQNESTAELLLAAPLLQQFKDLGVFVQMTYNRHVDLNKRNLICYKTAILSSLYNDESIDVKAIDLQSSCQLYQLEHSYSRSSVICNLYFQGESCCGQHSKFLY
ncbi:unnamed protein product [Bursaphelenchus okinawaensis]|uniref:Uncharacterized protein n=1 Tax=Bursaphelenchus okinawaensis TaxID=465554 RepID=A0A811KML6_9BILA|nr:unnamed protein product [Bursaphelenchus okinawaensis]CAG9105333.1 unnamed protein product [Bursaphelenchus okinawaensis]